jgi:hypothetical protein
MQDSIRQIIALMNEDGIVPGSTSVLTGAAMAQSVPNTDNPNMLASDNGGYGEPTEPEANDFTELEYKLTKRFLELIGGTERAREIINKCDDCEECLNLVTADDDDVINSIASTMPDDVGLPTNIVNMSSLYNPSTIAGPM